MTDSQFPAEDNKEIAPWKATCLNTAQEAKRKGRSTKAMNRGTLNFIWDKEKNCTYIMGGGQSIVCVAERPSTGTFLLL